MSACSSTGQRASFTPNEEFKQYWYAGKAELTSYIVDQARYGTNVPGEAVLIFVTEDLSLSKHVKLDNPAAVPSDAVSVLKLNATRQFNTGIYQYNLMSSVFTPLDHSKADRTLKVTTSVQDWCGHTWLQLDRKGNGYLARGFSYFESEGDAQLRLEDAWLEDEVWTTLRKDPTLLPLGEFRMIPGTFFSRLQHKAPASEMAQATLKKEEQTSSYSLHYPELGRTLTIRFENTFPYAISGWTEDDGKGNVTTARKNRTLQLPYWQTNKPSDAHLREALGLKDSIQDEIQD